jgi:hypothetical protein
MSTSVKTSSAPAPKKNPSEHHSYPLSVIKDVAPTFKKLEAALSRKINTKSPFEINKQLMDFQAMLSSARKTLEPTKARTACQSRPSEFTTQLWVEGTLELTGLLEEKTRSMYRRDPRGCAKLREELLHGENNIPTLVRRVSEYHQRLLIEARSLSMSDLTSPKGAYSLAS